MKKIIKTILILVSLSLLLSTAAYADKTIDNEEDIYISGGAIVEEGIESDKTLDSSRLKRYEIYLIIFLIINMIFIIGYVFSLNNHINKLKLEITNEFDDKEKLDELLEELDKLKNKNKARIFENLIFCAFIYALYYLFIFYLS